MHLHASALDALVFLAYLLIVGALLRTVAARNSENALGKALAFIY